MAANVFKDTTLLEQIMTEMPKEAPQALCRSLIKRNSYKSGYDMGELHALAYWLYVYGQEDLCLALIAPTHEIKYFQDSWVWGLLHGMWGLEIRILRARGEDEKADAIAQTANMQDHLPRRGQTAGDKAGFLEMHRKNVSFEDCAKLQEIAQAVQQQDPEALATWQFNGIRNLIGGTELGFYPNLNNRRADVEAKIAEYTAALKQA